MESVGAPLDDIVPVEAWNWLSDIVSRSHGPEGGFAGVDNLVSVEVGVWNGDLGGINALLVGLDFGEGLVDVGVHREKVLVLEPLKVAGLNGVIKGWIVVWEVIETISELSGEDGSRGHLGESVHHFCFFV